MKGKVTYLVGLFWVILIIGCTSYPMITMVDVSTPVSEQSRISLTAGRGVRVISVDEESDLRAPYYLDSAYIYFPSGRHTVVVDAERKFVNYSDYNLITNTRTVVTLSGDNLNFTHDFLPQHTYAFEFERFGDDYYLILKDVGGERTWESPKIASNAPTSGRVTNWDYPYIGPLVSPFAGFGIQAGYSNIKRESPTNVGIISGVNYGVFDISGQFVVQAGIGLNWKNFGISIVPELGGGFGSFYITQYHYAFMANCN